MEIIESLNIKLDGKNVSNFKSALVKLTEEYSRAGFRPGSSALTADEIKVIKDLKEKIA